MIKLQLCVIAANRTQPGNIKFIVKNNDKKNQGGEEAVPAVSLPFVFYNEGELVAHQIERLFKRVLGWEPGKWVLLEQIGFLDNFTGETPIILYGVCIPECVPIAEDGARWVGLDEIQDQNVVKLIQAAAKIQ